MCGTHLPPQLAWRHGTASPHWTSFTSCELDTVAGHSCQQVAMHVTASVPVLSWKVLSTFVVSAV